MSYHKFNEYARQDAIMQRLKAGQIIALISDAGMPGISDPGSELVSLVAT
jgi:16S rRNA (cytidine1402-2'-O)-methyltransferase